MGAADCSWQRPGGRAELTWDAGEIPWVPPAPGRAGRGGGAALGHEAGLALQRGRAAGGEVPCRAQLPVGDAGDGTLNLCESPKKKKRAFSGVLLRDATAGICC